MWTKIWNYICEVYWTLFIIVWIRFCFVFSDVHWLFHFAGMLLIAILIIILRDNIVKKVSEKLNDDINITLKKINKNNNN